MSRLPPSQRRYMDIRPSVSREKHHTQMPPLSAKVEAQLSSQPNIPQQKPKKRGRFMFVSVTIALCLVAGTIAVAYWWYRQALLPVTDDKSTSHIRLVIQRGASPQMIATELEQKRVVRSALAFQIYTRLHARQNQLQAGTYNLSPTDSTPEILQNITSGKVDTVTITFLPGATLSENKKVLQKAGYNTKTIDKAFAKSYSSPIFAGKPTTADIEGYIYGQTYQMPADATVETILQRSFDEFAKVMKDNNLEARYKKQGLSLYQGIILASIIQREAERPADQVMIAGIFLNRLKQHISLGSDVTYQYIADKTGQPRDPNLDSPYNTRRFGGLPPGPISTPGLSALEAVAKPAKTDYLYFLSGDDDKMYYGKTEAEHEYNKEKYCKQKCKIL